jgi:hypothetical protein
VYWLAGVAPEAVNCKPTNEQETSKAKTKNSAKYFFMSAFSPSLLKIYKKLHFSSLVFIIALPDAFHNGKY